jgi:polyprenyl P-hydroxybenzoate/phenylacrylic acid decarboxylase-like protein
MPGSGRRIIVGISGASGPIYGIRTLEALRSAGGIEIHLIVTEAARQTILYETNWTPEAVLGLAHACHDNRDLAAPLASGSFLTDAMIIAPCSMHTLSEVAHATGSNLLARAADVHLKERRRLILMTRETPLHVGHLRNMVLATEAGAVILPPVPAFYHRPETVDDIINHSVGKALDLLSVPHALCTRWKGPE